MPRKYISEERLLESINHTLREDINCKMCKFDSVKKLDNPDEEGCNWVAPVLRCSGVSTSICAPTAADVIRNYRSEYNVQ